MAMSCAMPYAHLANVLRLNDICDSLRALKPPIFSIYGTALKPIKETEIGVCKI
jgi:hypothetical protein